MRYSRASRPRVFGLEGFKEGFGGGVSWFGIQGPMGPRVLYRMHNAGTESMVPLPRPATFFRVEKTMQWGALMHVCLMHHQLWRLLFCTKENMALHELPRHGGQAAAEPLPTTAHSNPGPCICGRAPCRAVQSCAKQNPPAAAEKTLKAMARQ